MRQIALAAMLLASLHAPGPARASGGGNFIPYVVDPYGGTAAEQDAFYGEGRLGVLLGRSPRSRLFAGWRILHGLPVGREVGRTLAVPYCDAPEAGITAEWLAARTAIPGAAKLDFISNYRLLENYASIETCFADAYATASRTLRDRVVAHGADSPWVKAWLDGQDAVFASCNGNPRMPALAADAPAWLVQDRAYQLAAQALYERRLADAEARFAAIAADPASPWQPLGPYLAARAAVRAALSGNDPVAVARARDRLAALSAPDAYGHAAAAPLASALDFRTRPDERRAELAQVLVGPVLPATAAADFKDSRRLGQQPPGEPAYLDWLSVFGRKPDKPEGYWIEHYDIEQLWKTDTDALAHARARWAATDDPAWLIAAMAWSDPGPQAADLVAAARALPASHPAWLTATYHRIRLTPAADPAATRTELDAVLAQPNLPASTRNLFVAERAMVAANPADFIRFARRTAPCSRMDLEQPIGQEGCLGQSFVDELYETRSPEGRFGADALATIDRMPLPQRMALAENRQLPAPLRLDIALTSWTRAALLQDNASADRLAAGLADLLPQMVPDWRRFVSARPGSDKRFAAWFILAKLPGASVNLGPASTGGSQGGYVRPVGAVRDFEGAWPDWRFVPPDAAAPPVSLPAPQGDVACFGLCGGGAFVYRAPAFVAAEAVRADRERGRYAPAPDAAGAGFVWEELLAYAQAHPDDPRSPEALYWLIRVSRYGQGHASSSYRAFRLLHRRYPGSAWAKASPYFYN